ncbi:hypothetical protein JG688_00010972 [Phytophthora aleatoria]|uniref:Uncharacterized protein n=1 Tax=Phytophthora aleatoria TaxID=2496075 RepID=A0A8J5M1B2_9STRA|nr:hypothetical protein JG688_00010972 [Phytophthora aleatoria]
MSVPFQVAQQMDLSSKVKEIPLVSTKVEVQDLIGKTQLSDGIRTLVWLTCSGKEMV